MSFSLTPRQCREQTKDVTRRIGWANLKPGERVQQIEKGQGLKKGEHVVKIHVIECVSNTPEPLLAIYDYPDSEVSREGFPTMSRAEFIYMFCKRNNCTPNDIINRIEFKYVMKKEYTVVLLCPDSEITGTSLDGICVEIKASDPNDAVTTAQKQASDDMVTEPEPTSLRPLAVFEGHCENVIGQKYC